MSHDNSEKIRACKKAFNARLAKEQRYADYRMLCARLMAENGIDAEQAWRRAARKFYPINGAPHEFHFLDLEDGNTEVEPSDGKFAPKGAHGRLRVKAEKSDEGKLIAELKEQIDPTKTASAMVMHDWVANNMLNDYEDLNAADIPSRGALWLLTFARKDTKNEAAFGNMFVKLSEKKSLAEEDARRRDDGRKTFPMLDAFLASLDAPEAGNASV